MKKKPEFMERDHLFNNIMKAIAMFIIIYDFTEEEKNLIYKMINFKEK